MEGREASAHAPPEQWAEKDEDAPGRSRDQPAALLALVAAYLPKESEPALAPAEEGQTAQVVGLVEACLPFFAGPAPRGEAPRRGLYRARAEALPRERVPAAACSPPTWLVAREAAIPEERPQGEPLRAQAPAAARGLGQRRPQRGLALVRLWAVRWAAAIGKPARQYPARRLPFHRRRRTWRPGQETLRTRCKTPVAAATRFRKTDKSAHPQARAWRRKDRLALSS